MITQKTIQFSVVSVLLILVSLNSDAKVYKFDFQPDHTKAKEEVKDIMLRPGFTEITEKTVYDSKRGYGWENADGLKSRYQIHNPTRYQNSITNLNRDGVWGRKKSVFKIDLPNGHYMVYWLSCFSDHGEPNYYYFDISAEGKLKDSVKLPFKFLTQERMFEIDVTDGQLDLGFSPTRDWWLISALVIYPKGNLDGESTVKKIRKELYLATDDYLKNWKEVKPVIKEKYTPTQIEKDRGYVLFSRCWMEDIYPASRPRKEEVNKPLTAFMTPGEFEPMTFTIYALKELKGVKVSVTSLKGPDGAEIPSDKIDVRLVWCSPHPMGPNRHKWIKKDLPLTKHYINYPDMLVKRRPDQLINVDNDTGTVIPKGETLRYWLTVNAPDKLSAGKYSGEVNISFSNTSGSELPVKLDILPFKLKMPEDTTILGWYSWGNLYDLCYFYEYIRLKKTDPEMYKKLTQHAFERDEKNIRFLVDHNCNALLLNSEGRNTAWEKHKLVTPLLESYMKLYKKFNFKKPVIVQGTFIPGYKNKKGLKPETLEKIVENARKQIKEYQKVKKEKDWPDIFYYMCDEPNHPVRIALTKPFFKMLNEEKVGTFIPAMYPTMRTLENAGMKGIRCYSTGYHPVKVLQKQIKEDKDTGNQYWTYSNNAIYNPFLMRKSRFQYGFFMWCFGFKGITACTWNDTWLNPYNELHGRTGDLGATKDVDGPCPVIQWEAAREGVDDLKYIHTLENLIQQGLKSDNSSIRKVAEKARNELKSFKEKIDPDIRKYVFIDPDTNLPRYNAPVWKPGEYDINRKVIANYALKLYELLNNGKKPNVELTQKSFSVPNRVQAPKEKEVEKRILTCVHADTPPKIDGKADDKIWKKAPVFTDFKQLDVKGNATDLKAKEQTRVQFGWDDKYLYICAVCDQKNLDILKNNKIKLWDGDRLEVFIDCNNDKKTFLQLVTNVKDDKFSCNYEFNGDINRAVKVNYPKPVWLSKGIIGPESWTIEIAIPLSLIGKNPERDQYWGINIGRYNAPSRKNTTSSATFRKPWQYAQLFFDD